MENVTTRSYSSTASTFYPRKLAVLPSRLDLHENYYNKNILLQQEINKVNTKIKNDFRNHFVQASIVKPCPTKVNYMSLIESSFCAKERAHLQFTSPAMVLRNRSNLLL